MIHFTASARTPSVIFRAVILVTLACVALLGLDLWRSLSEREMQIRNIDAATTNLARALETHAGNAIDQTRGALTDLVERVENDGTSPRAVARLHTLVVREAAALPQIAGLFVYDENGRWLLSTEETLSTGFNNADRPYFIYHQRHHDHELHVGDPLVSRSSGKWVLPVSMRIDHPDGRFAGVALATLDLDFFVQFYRSLDTGRDGVVTLITTAGKIVVRNPFDVKYIGRDVTNSDFFQAIGKLGQNGSVLTRSSQDGVTRFVSYRTVPGLPLIVLGSLSKNEHLSEWIRNTIVHLATDIVFILLLVWLGRRLVRQMEQGAIAQMELERAHESLSKLNAKLQRQALYDGLTGLANRRHLDATLDRVYAEAWRTRTAIAIVLIDLDFFKQFNDTYGHLAGDDCLQAVSRQARDAVRIADALVARYGGEEIAVVLPGVSVAEALSVAERIRAAVYSMQIRHEHSPYRRVTISAGVCSMLPMDEASGYGSLLQCADEALYLAKSNGRNRVERGVLRFAAFSVTSAATSAVTSRNASRIAAPNAAQIASQTAAQSASQTASQTTADGSRAVQSVKRSYSAPT